MIDVFAQLSIILIIATAVAAIAKLLRQPLIISYIFTGILVSPYFFNIVPEGEALDTFIHIGISFLLFMVGLSLNPKIIKDVGKASTITGLGQVIFTSFFGFLIALGLGFTLVEGLYIAVALTFSSTIIIMKLLYDKGDLETLYGRISVGFLIVQDLVVVFALLFISSMSEDMTLFGIFVSSILPIIGIVIVLGFFSHFLLQKIVKIMAKSQELLLLFSVAWCFFLAALFAAFNFSMEMGALIAGVCLAMSPYRYEISAKMKPLRDFFLILFFISLGSQIIFGDVITNLPAIIIFSMFILIGNPLIVLTLMGLMGYTKRTGFMAGLTVAQISEFSLILVALGVSVGHLSQEILSTVTVIGLITISGSSYMITYSNAVYSKISKYLSIFEKKGKKVDEHKYHQESAYNLVLFGCNRLGMNMLNTLGKKKKEILVIDYNPDTVRDLAGRKYHCRYGDAGDLELLNEIQLNKARMVISTVDDMEVSLLLLNKCISENKNVIFIATATQPNDAIMLYEQGASYVIVPHLLGASSASSMIQDYAFDYLKFKKEKARQLKILKSRKKKSTAKRLRKI